MTLRHIVSWKVSGATTEERDAQSREMMDALIALNGVVPTLQSLTAHRNELFDGDNWDMTIIADFADEQGLADYVVHPAHEAAAEVIRRYAAGRVATDFTL